MYYIPRRAFYAQSTLPTAAGAFRLLRCILVRERITLLHAHQAFSALGLEALVHAQTMGYKVGEGRRYCSWAMMPGGANRFQLPLPLYYSRPSQCPFPPPLLHLHQHPPPPDPRPPPLRHQTVFTDHSLFGFADASSIITNKLLKAVLSGVGAVICVSHTSRENTVLRACLPPARVSVIPNGVCGLGCAALSPFSCPISLN